jgi:hypothetical protein
VILTVPVLGLSRVPMRCINVDFPEPEGPTMQANSPPSRRNSRRPTP